MRKSNIKSVMHWSIMGLIFGAPIVATLGSLIPKDYENVNNFSYVNVSNFEQGKLYRFNLSANNPKPSIDTSVYYIEVKDFYFDGNGASSSQPSRLRYATTFISSYIDGQEYYNRSGYVDLVLNYISGDTEYLKQYAYEIVPSIDYDLGYRTYNAMVDFKNLSINNWYNTMLNLTVGQPSGYDVVSVLKMYPLYAIWVVVLDLMYDCMCFIPTMCHQWLHKLEGEDE